MGLCGLPGQCVREERERALSHIFIFKELINDVMCANTAGTGFLFLM